MPATMASSSSREAYRAFVGAVDDTSVDHAVAHMNQLAAEGVERVVLALNTPGGNCNAGMRLYERLRALPFHLVTHAVSSVASMGVSIYLAGDERLVGPQCQFLLHPASFTAVAGKVFTVKILHERIAMLEANDQRERSILEGRTSLTEPQIRALVDAETIMGAEEAVTRGIAHKVVPFVLPPGQALVPIGQP